MNHPSSAHLPVAVRPLHSDDNPYVEDFASSLAETGAISVTAFTWDLKQLEKGSVVVFHWPNELFFAFSLRDRRALLHLFRHYRFVWSARLLKKVRFVWIAHNEKPHGVGDVKPWITSLFFKSLSGIIYLSASSKRIINETYPATRSIASLVTRHGSYRRSAIHEETALKQPASRPRLLFFGQVRPYKGLEGLIDAAIACPDACELHIVGMQRDAAYAESLRARAANHATIHLDLRDAPIDQGDLESILDAADGVILPYTSILNSGSAILALSRNRPILVPRLGSLTELHDDFGPDWIHHYDAKITPDDIRLFASVLARHGRPDRVAMDHYDWRLIAKEIRAFLAGL
jgi:beta-1,4-mannosyltransferase